MLSVVCEKFAAEFLFQNGDLLFKETFKETNTFFKRLLQTVSKIKELTFKEKREGVRNGNCRN